MSDDPTAQPATASIPERKPLTPAAQRALAEAEARRRAAEANAHALPRDFRARRARSRPAMATGRTRASPRIFEAAALHIDGACRLTRLSPSLGICPHSENKILIGGRAGRVSQVGLEPAAIGGLALGVRSWRRGGDIVAGADGWVGRFRPRPNRRSCQATARRRGQRDDLEARRHPDVRHPVDVIRPSTATPSRRGCICGPAGSYDAGRLRASTRRN